jgi:hypothetical protein
MIDTDKYKGHTPAPWTGVTIDTMRQYPDSPTMILAQDAPLLLAEVKRLRKLRKQLEDCKRQIQFTADWIRDRGEDTHAKELDEFLEWME